MDRALALYVIFFSILPALPSNAKSLEVQDAVSREQCFEIILKTTIPNDHVVATEEHRHWPPKDWKKYFDSVPKNLNNSEHALTREILPTTVEMNPTEEAVIYTAKIDNDAPILIDESIQKTLDLHAPNYKYVCSQGYQVTLKSPDGTTFSLPSSFFFRSSELNGSLLKRCDHAAEVIRASLNRDIPNVPPHPVDGRHLYDNNLQMYKNVQSKLSYFKSNLHQASVDVFPIQAVGPPRNNMFRYGLVTTIEEEHSITEIHDTVILPGEKNALARLLTTNEEDFYPRMLQVRARNLVTVDPRIHYQHVNEWEHFPHSHTRTKYNLTKGKQKQIENLQEVLAEVYPDYAERRKWSEAQVTELYQHTLATMNDTPFIKVREKMPGGGTTLVGTFGVNQAHYQKVRFFNQVTQKWAEVVGTPETGWHSPIPILGMEDIKGHAFTLERPAVLDRVVTPSLANPSTFQGTLPPGFVPDLSRGVFYYKGQISEPTKLWVRKKSILRDDTYRTVWKFMADAAFPSWRSENFNLNGSKFYTYNPSKEWQKLLGLKGFQKVPSIPTMTIDGRPWDVLSVSYRKIDEDNADGNTGMAKQLLENFIRNVNSP